MTFLSSFPRTIPVLAMLVALSLPAWAQSTRPDVEYATRSDTSQALRNYPVLPPRPAVLGEIFERPLKILPNREGSSGPSGPDPVLQEGGGGPAAATLSGNFEGIGNRNGVLPPDTTGAIGPTHFVQMVNLSMAVYDRTGAAVFGPINSNSIWAGFGGPCQTENDGDPVVLYDKLADRFVVSQFALPNFPLGPFYECIAISQTGDPTDAWHRYEFLIHQTKLDDYPKLGVWPDGYYMSINQFTCRQGRGCSWGGAGVVAFERDQMLAGLPARRIYFDLYGVDPNLGGFLPSDVDGPAPPAGAANIFSLFDDNAWGYSPDQLQLWAFHVDWLDTALSTFTHVSNLGTAAFDSSLCGYARACIPQGSTIYKVDTLADRLMFRLQYRNFGDHETLVTNHSVDVGGDRAGIRWYELRKTGGGPWSILQQGTYAPGTDHRWMGSIAMNGQGDIGLGFSITGPSLLPSIRTTGRIATDPAGTLPQGELNIITGGGYQTHSAARWGDYSHMSVDPTDDCTFWYTQEYFTGGASVANWQTRIGSFKLRDCGPVAPTHDVAVTGVTAPSPVVVNTAQTVAVNVSNLGNQDETITLTLGDSLGASIPEPQQVFALAAGASTTRDFSWTPTADGAHVLTATAGITLDDNGANNSGTANSTVNAVAIHDGTVSSVTAPSPVTVNTLQSVAVNVSNLGNVSDSFSVALTDSLGATIGAPQVFDLGAGASSIRNFAWTPTVDGAHVLTGTATVAGDSSAGNNSTIGNSTVNPAAVAPTIESISPNSMKRGTTLAGVSIVGTGFVTGATVSFTGGIGAVPVASNVVVSSGEITLTITVGTNGPKKNRVWNLVVTNPGGQSASGTFTVTP